MCEWKSTTSQIIFQWTLLWSEPSNFSLAVNVYIDCPNSKTLIIYATPNLSEPRWHLCRHHGQCRNFVERLTFKVSPMNNILLQNVGYWSWRLLKKWIHERNVNCIRSGTLAVFSVQRCGKVIETFYTHYPWLVWSIDFYSIDNHFITYWILIKSNWLSFKEIIFQCD